MERYLSMPFVMGENERVVGLDETCCGTASSAKAMDQGIPPPHTSRRISRAILMTLVLGSGFCSRLLPALMPVGPLFHAGSGVSTCSPA